VLSLGLVEVLRVQVWALMYNADVDDDLLLASEVQYDDDIQLYRLHTDSHPDLQR
jgi:hypothetical protein